jgi:hypothetical protein
LTRPAVARSLVATFPALEFRMNRPIRYASLLSLLAALALSPAAFAQHADMMGKMDGNGDGRISAAEHAAGAQAMFDAADADHDGYVTAAEMKAGHAAMDKHGDAHDMGDRKGCCDMPCCDKMDDKMKHDMKDDDAHDTGGADAAG